ncbi:MAG TPA: hypothetical protein VJN64_05460 [Terriglobales bacterium]|nr:hypothetical protein [Terriglobales bacterium]
MVQRGRSFAERSYSFVTANRVRMMVTAVLVLMAAGIFKYVLAGLMLRSGASPTEMRSQDAILTGLFCAIIVSIALGAERFRREQFRERVKVVSDLNHHLRNALEIIIHGHLLPQNSQTKAIVESVKRIDQALQTIVPEEMHSSPQPLPQLSESMVAPREHEEKAS